MKAIKSILMLVLWGFCICIGFWMGHKFTEGIDKLFGRIRADHAAKQIAKQEADKIEEALGTGPAFSEKDLVTDAV